MSITLLEHLLWAGEDSHRGEHTELILLGIYDVLSEKLENMN